MNINYDEKKYKNTLEELNKEMLFHFYQGILFPLPIHHEYEMYAMEETSFSYPNA